MTLTSGKHTQFSFLVISSDSDGFWFHWQSDPQKQAFPFRIPSHCYCQAANNWNVRETCRKYQSSHFLTLQQQLKCTKQKKKKIVKTTANRLSIGDNEFKSGSLQIVAKWKAGNCYVPHQAGTWLRKSENGLSVGMGISATYFKCVSRYVTMGLELGRFSLLAGGMSMTIA